MQRSPTIIWFGLALAAGCGSNAPSDRDLGGLVTSPESKETPIDVEAAAREPTELGRALGQAHHRVSAALGPHEFRGSSKLRVNEGDAEVEALDDVTEIDFDSDGSYRAILDNSREYGQHTIYSGGELYLRPRFGDYHRRAPNSEEEPAQIRDRIYATLGEYFELVAPAAQPRDDGETTAAGRPARRIAFSLASKPRRRTENSPQRAWRESITVNELSGQVALDQASGAVLEGHLEASLAFERDGRHFAMTLAVDHAIRNIGARPAITAPPPEQTVATPMQNHELAERNELLRGLAAPAGRRRKP